MEETEQNFSRLESTNNIIKDKPVAQKWPCDFLLY